MRVICLAVLAGLFSLSALGANSAPNTSTCPSEFYTVPLMANASLCQRFSDKLPATMIYHAKQMPNAVMNYYLQQDLGLTFESAFRNRKVLSNAENSIRVVVSPDNQGTQVDILFNPPKETEETLANQ